MSTPQIAVRQLDNGMDLGPAHKNIALNHLVARSMGRVMDDRDPAFVHAPGGPEDDSPSTWHRARKEEAKAPVEPEVDIEELRAITPPKAYIMETDIVLCEMCYEDVQTDRRTDHDPNAWLHMVRPWNLFHHQCEHCGTRAGDQSDMKPIPAPDSLVES